MTRQLHRGAFRTALAYVLFVMGGTALLVTLRAALGANWYFNSHGYVHPAFRVAFLSGATFFLRILASPLVFVWLLLGVLLYLCALLLLRLSKKLIVSRLLLAVISFILSSRILIWLPPVPFPSLPALYLMMIVAGLLGAWFGFFLPPRV